MTAASKQIVIILLGTLILVLLYTQTHNHHAQSYAQSIDFLRQLKQLDATFNQDVLKVRYGLLLHYDPLKNNSIQIKSLLREFKKVDFYYAHIGQSAQSSIVQRIEGLDRLINDHHNLVERFKSRNAVLKNSSRYLPIAVDSMVNMLTERQADGPVINRITELLVSTLSFSVTAKDAFKARVVERIGDIEKNRHLYPEDMNDQLDHLLVHAHIIIREKAAVDDLVEQITSTAIAQQLDVLGDAYRYYHEIRVGEDRIYQAYLYLFAIILLLYIGYILLRLRNRTIALNRTITDLDYQKFALDQHSIVSISDVNGKIIYVNDRMLAISQYSREELLGQDLRVLNSGHHSQEFFADMWRTVAKGKVWRGELCNHRKDGQNYWVDSTIVPFVSTHSKPYQYVSISSDITEHKLLEEALFHEKELAQVTLQAIADGVITTDIDGKVDYINPRAERLTGWRQSEAKGQALVQVFPLRDSSTQKPITDLMKNSLKGESLFIESNVLLVNRNGEEYSVEVAVTPLLNRQSLVIGAVVAVHDVTAVRTLALQMSYQASHDALTGLVNRREFERRLSLLLENAKERDHGIEHALCYLDLDQFKVVNDTCGHVAGDELLRQLATILSSRIRDRDTLARLGGDEFGILLGECPLSKALAISEDVCETVKDFRFVWSDKTFELGVSIGLVQITEHSENINSLMSAADAACYAAKDKGRNRVNVYQPDDIELQQRYGEMQWVPRLAQALTENRFELYCQPIVAAQPQSEKGRHYEVLLRMRDEKNHLVPPGAFIPAAERYNLMSTIDRWVVRETFVAYQKYALNNSDMRYDTCNINLSGASLNDKQFLKFLHDQIEACQIPGNVLCFEITETVAVANLTEAIRFIKELKNKGCRFALDDFGSGLSSFAYLKNLPVDFLKIDGNFVIDIADDLIDFAMVRSINEIGHVMGLKTIAEYVENKRVEAKVREIGVDYLQGHSISSPIPLSQFMLERVTQKKSNTSADDKPSNGS